MTILLGCAGRRQVHERDGRFFFYIIIIIINYFIMNYPKSLLAYNYHVRKFCSGKSRLNQSRLGGVGIE